MKTVSQTSGASHPLQKPLEVTGQAGKLVIKLFQELLLAQSVDHRTDALGKAEKGKIDLPEQVSGLTVQIPGAGQQIDNIKDKVWEDIDSQLHPVHQNSFSPNPVASVQNSDSSAFKKDLRVAVYNQTSATGDE